MSERAVAHIDTAAMRHNCGRFSQVLEGDAALCVVVKADGYGHGLVTAARAAKDGGAAWLAVATAAEAAALRTAGIEGRVLVMGALSSDELRASIGAGADVVAWEPGFLDVLQEMVAGWNGFDFNQQPLSGSPRVHVKLDTGMGRLGAKTSAAADALVERIAGADGLELAGAMTHFATADELHDDYFPAQLERFRLWARPLQERYPGIILHAANSAATLRDPACHFDMVRCGVGIYGLDPFQEDPLSRGLEPAMALSSWLAAVRPFEPGESAGYGRRWTAKERTHVGTIPIGYGDGWRRGLTNDCDVLVGGRRVPLVGTVSMDNITVDLGPDADVCPGDEVVLIGRQGEERILCEEVARRLETINYEVTCGLTPRVRREPV